MGGQVYVGNWLYQGQALEIVSMQAHAYRIALKYSTNAQPQDGSKSITNALSHICNGSKICH